MNLRVQAALSAASESIVMAYGERAQIIHACEEMAELTKVLCKRLNGKDGDVDDAICEEIADVLIMTNQLAFMFHRDAVEAKILEKLERTLDRIRAIAQPKQEELPL